MVAWIQIECGCCGGLEWGGESPRECKECRGTGILHVSENDRIALYPGGPFLGSEPGLYQEEIDLWNELNGQFGLGA